jgi:hypothetical protein
MPDKREGRKKPPKLAFKLVKQAWKHKWSPFGVLRKSPNFLSNKWLNSYAKNRISQNLPEKHR